ncbi:zinc finger protein ZAT11-like [Cicer arietinum]|uniref:Zinc finger protein ZAT11-like n=1 Tax=Cicer arietinum TaxID=3827 RepID=A0A1S2XX23_CICAR|nr:zinc finger protein ZAT11-like [Cicer arietinum]
MKRQRNEEVENINLANCLILLSHPKESKYKKHFGPTEFECITCNRKFSSFQALGGHRASHKKPKLDTTELKVQAQTLSLWNKPKMHGCYICGKEFSVGQALGGHMRRHRIALNEGVSKKKKIVGEVPILKRSNSKKVMCLDLNLTPLHNDLNLLFGNMPPKVHTLFNT